MYVLAFRSEYIKNSYINYFHLTPRRRIINTYTWGAVRENEWMRGFFGKNYYQVNSFFRKQATEREKRKHDLRWKCRKKFPRLFPPLSLPLLVLCSVINTLNKLQQRNNTEKVFLSFLSLRNTAQRALYENSFIFLFSRSLYSENFGRLSCIPISSEAGWKLTEESR